MSILEKITRPIKYGEPDTISKPIGTIPWPFSLVEETLHDEEWPSPPMLLLLKETRAMEDEQGFELERGRIIIIQHPTKFI